MKKVLFLLFATIAIVSCGKKGDGEAEQAAEQPISEVVAPTPTDDPEADAKAVADYKVAAIDACQDLDELENVGEKLSAADETFNSAAEGNADYKAKFDAASEGTAQLVDDALKAKAEELTPDK